MGAEWEGPTLEWSTADIQQRLAGVGVRTRLALAPAATPHPAVAAFCGWMPAMSEGSLREPVPGLAHLWMLFVEQRRWGSGLASDLLEWATAGMLAAGYDAARLWTPTGQARARAFYERRGWRPTGRDVVSAELRLPVVEYRVELLG